MSDRPWYNAQRIKEMLFFCLITYTETENWGWYEALKPDSLRFGPASAEFLEDPGKVSLLCLNLFLLK